jgi:hypothetical protein
VAPGGRGDRRANDHGADQRGRGDSRLGTGDLAAERRACVRAAAVSGVVEYLSSAAAQLGVE